MIADAKASGYHLPVSAWSTDATDFGFSIGQLRTVYWTSCFRSTTPKLAVGLAFTAQWLIPQHDIVPHELLCQQAQYSASAVLH